jgi:hypothetical protein
LIPADAAHDATHAAASVHYRFETRMQELRCQYEAKAAEIRSEYLSELGALNGGGEE